MWEKLKDRLLRRFGARAQEEAAPTDEFVRRYEDPGGDAVTAVIAGKLASLTLADSAFGVTAAGGGAPTPRTELLRECLERFWREDAPWVTAQAFGKGGMVLLPVVTAAGRLRVCVVDQDRMAVLEREGARPVHAVVLADEMRRDGRTYRLLVSYRLRGGTQTLRCRAVDESGAEVPLRTLERWAALTEEFSIGGTDRLLLARLLCPRDNRTTDKGFGVPITYGVEGLVEELAEHARIYRREYRLTRPMLGLDASLWRDPDGAAAAPDIRMVRRTVQDSEDPFIPFEPAGLDAGGGWQYYAPPVRHEAMEARWQSLCRRIEKGCGLSQGILTERQSVSYANRDEVRAALYDTFGVVRAMRDRWEAVMDDLARAADALAEHFGLTPPAARDEYALSFSWDTSLLESTSEAFAQLSELHRRGGATLAELRAWVMGGSAAEAEKAIRGAGGNAGTESTDGTDGTDGKESGR